ncbi:MAG: HEPN domain-containing protein [Chitinophagaceae bacterium]
MNAELNKADKKSILKQGINKATEFLVGADFFRIRGQNKMAAYMLHQATEHALHTILKIKICLYLNTHNLDKLIRYCSMVSYTIGDIFRETMRRMNDCFSCYKEHI